MDTNNVIPLGKNTSLLQGEPDEELVALLEGLAAQARSGALRGIAYVGVRDGGILTNWHGQVDRHDIIAGVSMLQWRILDRADLHEREG